MKTILIVECNVDVGAFLVEAISEETPYQAIRVPDSALAMQTVNEVVPDLFLLDYHLPVVNGLELYDQLHAQKKLKKVPAIILSTNLAKQEQEIKKRNILGMDKPVELEMLLMVLKDLLD